ncbi:hypothetical protein AGMMS50249_5170 [candidate division SR1 bacterium]|nr:hypothetical protein AGMMS50249_5170 [candidate division SR1 bacterium]
MGIETHNSVQETYNEGDERVSSFLELLEDMSPDLREQFIDNLENNSEIKQLYDEMMTKKYVEEVIQIAEKSIGAQYQMGADTSSSKNKSDCSGLIYGSLKKLGVDDVQRGADAMYKDPETIKDIPLPEVRRGDIMVAGKGKKFKVSHVELVLSVELRDGNYYVNTIGSSTAPSPSGKNGVQYREYLITTDKQGRLRRTNLSKADKKADSREVRFGRGDRYKQLSEQREMEEKMKKIV